MSDADQTLPSSDIAMRPRRHPGGGGIAVAALSIGGVFCAAFAVMAVIFPLAVASQTHDVWALIQGLFTSADYSFGPHSSEAKHAVYRQALRSLSLHTIAGGVALLAATTQFIPALRRRWPVVHRASGALVIVLVAASMIGSVVLQASHPLAATLSGAGFGIGLMSLCGLTLTELVLAVLAIRARDIRSHMGWMALLYASLLTAPVLRIQWLLFGATGLPLDEANLALAMFLVPETILLMAVWMASVGARDLGLAAPTSILPPVVLRVLSVLAAMVAIQEGCLAPVGIDLIRALRGASHTLPISAVLWGLATAGFAAFVPGDLARLAEGKSVRPLTMLCALAAAVGALLVAFTLRGGDLQALAQRSVFAAWGGEIVILLVLARRSGLGQVGPWETQWLYLALAPSLWPFLACSYIPLAVGAPIAITTAMAIAYATIAMLGFASAFGLRVRVAKRRAVLPADLAPAT